jgi:ornithine carbamoyltransferase
MPTRTTKRDFRQLSDLGVDEILQLLNHAAAMKNQRSMGARRKPLGG